MTESQIDEAVPSIALELETFISHISSLEQTLPLSLLMIRAAHKVAADKRSRFEAEHGKVQADGSTAEIAPGEWQPHFRLTRRVINTLLAAKTVPRSFLVALVSQYDAFLGRLIRALFYMQPAKLNASERTLTFSQLVEFGSIDAAKEHIIEKEVEAVLRKSHAEQFDWLENKFDVQLRNGLDAWKTFIEVTERRNLFVHNSGIVSSQYLKVLATHKVPISSETKLGSELHVTPIYFLEAYHCIFEIGVKLAHVLWRKVYPAQRVDADASLNSICYELLVEERYPLAKNMLDFGATTLKKWSSEQSRRTSIINRAQAYKWSGDEDTASAILDGEDWTATSDMFRLAEAVLRDDLDRACQIMRKLGPNGDVAKSDYRDWPLFREMRKNVRFLETFREVFSEPLKNTPRLAPDAKLLPESTSNEIPIADLVEYTNTRGGGPGEILEVIELVAEESAAGRPEGEVDDGSPNPQIPPPPLPAEP